jgi:hypothetical protein
MTTPVWPTYAAVLLASYAEQRESGLLSSDMDSGPSKTVLVKSRVMVRRPLTVLFGSRTDYLAFLAWFQSTLSNGALWFTWTDPVRKAAVQARIKDGTLGDAKPVASVALDAGWMLTLTLETWQ